MSLPPSPLERVLSQLDVRARHDGGSWAWGVWPYPGLESSRCCLADGYPVFYLRRAPPPLTADWNNVDKYLQGSPDWLLGRVWCSHCTVSLLASQISCSVPYRVLATHEFDHRGHSKSPVQSTNTRVFSLVLSVCMCVHHSNRSFSLVKKISVPPTIWWLPVLHSCCKAVNSSQISLCKNVEGCWLQQCESRQTSCLHALLSGEGYPHIWITPTTLPMRTLSCTM